MIWYQEVIQKLNATGIFKECLIIGAKVRAMISIPQKRQVGI